MFFLQVLLITLLLTIVVLVADKIATEMHRYTEQLNRTNQTRNRTQSWRK